MEFDFEEGMNGTLTHLKNVAIGYISGPARRDECATARGGGLAWCAGLPQTDIKQSDRQGIQLHVDPRGPGQFTAACGSPSPCLFLLPPSPHTTSRTGKLFPANGVRRTRVS
jgi:hypothetical protein